MVASTCLVVVRGLEPLTSGLITYARTGALPTTGTYFRKATNQCSQCGSQHSSIFRPVRAILPAHGF